MKRHPEEISDDELLELLLILTAPELDAHSLTNELLEKSKTLARVLKRPILRTGSISQLEDIEAVFRLSQIIAIRIAKAEFDDRPFLENYSSLLRYLNQSTKVEHVQHFGAIFLSSNNRVIENAILSRGTVNVVYFEPRELFAKALRVKASAILTYLGKPEFHPPASPHDIALFENITSGSKMLDLGFHDHLLLCNGKAFSMKTGNYVSVYTQEF